jgi:hypothetical protein
MEYSVTCLCQKAIPVTAAQAGTEVACSCGRTIKVPRLSELRLTTGRDAYEAGVVSAIQRLIRTGELPYGDTCALSGWPTNDVYELLVECERPWAKQVGKSLPLPWEVLLGLFSPISIWRREVRTEIHGRQTVIRVPLRVRQEHHAWLSRMRSQRKLRRLLGTVPIYAQLLHEYPDAYISTSPDR